MTFRWKDAEELKKQCDKSLRDNGIKPPNRNRWSKKRKGFAKPDDSKIRLVNGSSYTEWMDNKGKEIEPLEANPDLWEDDLHNTVDG